VEKDVRIKRCCRTLLPKRRVAVAYKCGGKVVEIYFVGRVFYVGVYMQAFVVRNAILVECAQISEVSVGNRVGERYIAYKAYAGVPFFNEIFCERIAGIIIVYVYIVERIVGRIEIYAHNGVLQFPQSVEHFVGKLTGNENARNAAFGVDRLERAESGGGNIVHHELERCAEFQTFHVKVLINFGIKLFVAAEDKIFVSLKLFSLPNYSVGDC